MYLLLGRKLRDSVPGLGALLPGSLSLFKSGSSICAGANVSCTCASDRKGIAVLDDKPRTSTGTAIFHIRTVLLRSRSAISGLPLTSFTAVESGLAAVAARPAAKQAAAGAWSDMLCQQTPRQARHLHAKGPQHFTSFPQQLGSFAVPALCIWDKFPRRALLYQITSDGQRSHGRYDGNGGHIASSLQARAYLRVLQSGQGIDYRGHLPQRHGSTSLEQNADALHLQPSARFYAQAASCHVPSELCAVETIDSLSQPLAHACRAQRGEIGMGQRLLELFVDSAADSPANAAPLTSSRPFPEIRAARCLACLVPGSRLSLLSTA